MEATRLMAQRFLSIKNWEKYQANHKQNFPWIKLHRALLGDRNFLRLPVTCRYLYIGLLLLASESNNKVYNDATWLGQRLYIDPTLIDLRPLYREGFLNTSNLSRTLLEERRGEEIEKRGDEIAAAPLKVWVEFDTFWNQYPKKQGKDAARKAWGKLNPDHTLNTIILTRLEQQKASEQWQRENGKYIPHASTWINGKRWEDELQVKPMRLMPIQPKVVVENIQPTPAIGKHEAESILKRLGMKHLGEL
jgi:hypothetical protein